MPRSSYHRRQAEVCRALAGSCLHKPAGNALRELAAEHDAKADRIEAEITRFSGARQMPPAQESDLR